eukprot:jgi/Hompol1/13/HPOL_002426-RA
MSSASAASAATATAAAQPVLAAKTTTTTTTDRLLVRELVVRNIIGVDAWERSKRQPLVIDVAATSDIGASGLHDLLSESVSYSAICKEVERYSEATAFRSLEALAGGIAFVCLSKFPTLQRVSIVVRKPRALLHAASISIKIERSRADFPALLAASAHPDHQDHSLVPAAVSDPLTPIPAGLASLEVAGDDEISINDLELQCIIGVNAWEREERQRVIINMKLHVKLDAQMLAADYVPRMHNCRTITRLVSKLVEDSDFKTVEALVLRIAILLVHVCYVPKVTVRVEKPSALIFAAAAGVEITRTREELLASGVFAEFPDSVLRSPSLRSTVYLAVGTNLGNRTRNIEFAIEMLVAAGISILDTSFLYETSPMYVTDQPMFLNACIKVETTLEPIALLDQLKQIESNMGRDLQGGIRNGPRPIDLDILFYNNLEMKTDTLIIPHPRIAEREFVLCPLCDIAAQLEHPGKFRTCKQLLALLKHQETSDQIWKVLPIRGRVLRLHERTFIMGILNTTPDSFSDGGKHNTVDLAVQHALEMIEQGADIIDIGGQSTRPNAVEVGAEEEILRVVPVIQAIRKHNSSIFLSIDTFHSSVAKAALDAGADLINDVSGGNRDPNMYRTMSSTHAPVCLMHMRGNSQTMSSLTDYSGDVIKGIQTALGECVSNALRAGVYRWNILADPGIGFAKTFEQNFEILRRLRDIVSGGHVLDGFPLLVGPSKKGFIGLAIGESDPVKRSWGTAGACTAAIAGGASILRVHDVKEMLDVAKVADMCFRK